MYFRPDNFADVFGLGLAVILVLISYVFMRQVKHNEAGAWADASKSMLMGSILFAVGMCITLSTIIFNDDSIREFLNMIGDSF